MLFLFSRYLNFLSGLFVHVEKRLVYKDKVNFKIYDIKTWLKNNCNPNASKSKDNQTMEFAQFIEYNMRNIFLEKLYTRCDGETIPRPFSKKLN